MRKLSFCIHKHQKCRSVWALAWTDQGLLYPNFQACLVSVIRQADLCLTRSEMLETGFLAMRFIFRKAIRLCYWVLQ